MEVKSCGFQKAILEVVEVEENAVNIHLRLRIALGEIQSSGTTNLHIRQLADSLHEQFLLLKVISAASLTTALYGIIEGCIAKIRLEITHLVVANCVDMRNWQLSLLEMTCEIDKSVVLFP